MYVRVWTLQQDSCGEEERPRLVTVVKASAKPRRAKLLPKGRKLNNRKRGRPKKAALVTEKKNKKNQSALDLLHAKTLSAAPTQGQNMHISPENVHMTLDNWLPHPQCELMLLTDAYRSAQSPFYQLPPKVQQYPSSQLLLSSTPPALQQLLGALHGNCHV